jgi:hypothetical protein
MIDDGWMDNGWMKERWIMDGWIDNGSMMDCGHLIDGWREWADGWMNKRQFSVH